MNFYTLLPNGYPNIVRAPAISPPQRQSNVPLIQSILSQALKISIANYATAFQQAIVNNKREVSQDITHPSEKISKQVDSNRMEDKTDNAQIQKKIEKENISYKLNDQMETASKGKQNSVQNITNDQPSNSNNEAQASNKKQDSNVQFKKDKIRNKKDTRSVGIPSISLILTAQLPQPTFTQLQLKKRKDSLFRRQVVEWHQKMKNRREKRQIRMLNR